MRIEQWHNMTPGVFHDGDVSGRPVFALTTLQDMPGQVWEMVVSSSASVRLGEPG